MKIAISCNHFFSTDLYLHCLFKKTLKKQRCFANIALIYRFDEKAVVCNIFRCRKSKLSDSAYLYIAVCIIRLKSVYSSIFFPIFRFYDKSNSDQNSRREIADFFSTDDSYRLLIFFYTSTTVTYRKLDRTRYLSWLFFRFKLHKKKLT